MSKTFEETASLFVFNGRTPIYANSEDAARESFARQFPTAVVASVLPIDYTVIAHRVAGASTIAVNVKQGFVNVRPCKVFRHLSAALDFAIDVASQLKDQGHSVWVENDAEAKEWVA